MGTPLNNRPLSDEEITYMEKNYTTDFGRLYAEMPKQLIHGNPTGDSFVYENGEPVGIKGYEIYNVSHIRLFDVMWCAGEINLQDLDAYLKMLREILQGYDSINPLTPAEKQAIYYVLCTSAMNCAAYCDENLDVTKRNLQALSYLSQNKEIFMNLISC